MKVLVGDAREKASRWMHSISERRRKTWHGPLQYYLYCKGRDRQVHMSRAYKNLRQFSVVIVCQNFMMVWCWFCNMKKGEVNIFSCENRPELIFIFFSLLLSSSIYISCTLWQLMTGTLGIKLVLMYLKGTAHENGSSVLGLGFLHSNNINKQVHLHVVNLQTCWNLRISGFIRISNVSRYLEKKL